MTILASTSTSCSEIFEQPARLRDTVTHGAVRDEAFGESAPSVFPSRRYSDFWRAAQATMPARCPTPDRVAAAAPSG